MKYYVLTLGTFLSLTAMTVHAQTKPATTKPATTKPATTTAAKPVTTPQPKITNRIDSVSYLVGMNIGASIIRDFKEADIDVVLAGIRDLYYGQKPRVNDADNSILNGYFQEKNNQKQMEQFKLVKEESEMFLKENKTKPGVMVTPSGLQYQVIQEGDGERPGPTSKVKVHYVGTTPDGREFDSSVKRGQPITFGLDQVIKGWTEGLQLMKVGSKYRFFIPQELAYGANPQPNSIIEPFMALVFEVELIAIEK